MTGIFLTTKDLQIITGKSYPTAWRYLQLIKDSIGKTKSQKVTLREYCKYENIDPGELNGLLQK
jgi:hypothetical protein